MSKCFSNRLCENLYTFLSKDFSVKVYLKFQTFTRQRPNMRPNFYMTKVLYRNQSTDLPCKLMDWSLYHKDLRHERVNRSKMYLTIKALESLNWYYQICYEGVNFF